MIPAFDVCKVHLLKEECSEERGGRNQRRYQRPDQPVPQRFGSCPVAPAHAGGMAGGRHALWRAFLRQQRAQHRDAQHHHPGRDNPECAPPDHPHRRNIDHRHQRFRQCVAKPRYRQRAATIGHEPARHSHHRRVAGHALPGESQREDDERQRPGGRVQRHGHASGGERDQDPDAKGAHPETIGQPAGPQHQRRRGHGAHAVDPAPIAVAQPEFGPDLPGKDRDEEGLSETGKKSEKHPGRQPARVLTQKPCKAHTAPP